MCHREGGEEWPPEESNVLGLALEAEMPHGQAVLTGIPRETLVPEEGEALSSRFCQTHKQSGAQVHREDASY